MENKDNKQADEKQSLFLELMKLMKEKRCGSVGLCCVWLVGCGACCFLHKKENNFLF